MGWGEVEVKDGDWGWVDRGLERCGDEEWGGER